MKVLFFFAIMALSAFQEQYGVVAAKSSPVASRCMEETKVTQETIDSFVDDPEKEPTEEFYCYLHCVFKGIGVIDENGEVEVELYKAMFAVDTECLEGLPKIEKCSDLEALMECNKE